MPPVEALVVHGHQSRIGEPGHRSGLALESGEELLIAGVAHVHHLQRDRAVEADVQAAVHGRHAAGGDHGVDAVAAIQYGADERVGWVAAVHACILDSDR